MIRGPSVHQSAQRREGVWPRVYPMRLGHRLLWGGVGVALLAGGSVILAHSPFGFWTRALLPILFSALGVYLLASVRAEHILLYEDAIEFSEVGKRARRLSRDEISGLRWVPQPYGLMQLVLELRGGQRPFKLAWLHETDAVLSAWFASIPNLAMVDRARAEAERFHSLAAGASELARSRRVTRLLAAVSSAVCGWGFIYPRPYPLAVATLGVIPLVGVASLLVYRGHHAFDDRTSDSRSHIIVTMLLMPVLILVFRSVVDFSVLDWKPLLGGAIAGALALAAATAYGDAKMRGAWRLTGSVVLLACYLWSGLALANAFLDAGTSEVLRSAVRGKDISDVRYTRYHLTLDPWGPVTETKRVEVGRALYEATHVGDHVCVVLSPGALDARWYVVQRCVDETQ